MLAALGECAYALDNLHDCRPDIFGIYRCALRAFVVNTIPFSDLTARLTHLQRHDVKLQCSDEHQNTISIVLALSGPRDWTPFKVFLDFASPTLIV